MTGFLTLHADPTSNLHAATKSYVDEVAQGVAVKPTAKIASTANLAGVYNNGTAGVGSYLEASSNGALPTIDGNSTWAQYDGVLLKDQTNAEENGRYYVDTVGDAGTKWKLIRCQYCDTAAEIPGSYIFVTDGTANANTGWVMTVADPDTFVIGTDDITIIQFSGAGTYSAGTGLDLTGTVFSHTDTSSQASVNNSGNTFIQDVTLDGFGHVTGLTSASVTVNDGTLSMGVSGTGLSGSASFTANDSDNVTFTVTSNATNANTPSTIVARDASGNFSAGTITAALTGNASTASSAAKWTTARTIGMSGDVSSDAVSIDGSGNVTITNTVVADDSHNHVISNVDGLQTALDAKQAAATALTTSTTFGGDVSGAYNAIAVSNDSHSHTTSTISGLLVSNFNGSAITTSAEAFADNDTTLMTSAAIDDRILSYGYTTAVGDITGVTAGSGLTGGGTSGSVTLNVGAGTGISVAADTVSLATAGAGAATYSSGISAVTVDAYGRVTSVTGSAGYTTNTGTVTSVAAGSYLTGGTITTTGTLAVDATTAATANKIVARDGNGYVFAAYYNSNGTFSTTGATSGMARFTGTNGSDTYGRSYTAQAAATLLSGSTMNISGSSTSCTGNAATATTLQTARTIGGVSFNGSANINLPGVNTTGNQNTSGTAANITTSDCRPNANQYFGGSGGEYFYYDNSNSLVRGYVNSAEVMRLYGGTTGCHFDGDVIAYSTTISDERLKDNIETVEGSIEKLKQIRGVTFTRKHNGEKSAGVIAQEIEKVLPEAVKEKTLGLQTGDEETLYKVVEYDALHALLIEAVKELAARVKELEAKVG
jgi:hypothetical protein